MSVHMPTGTISSAEARERLSKLIKLGETDFNDKQESAAGKFSLQAMVASLVTKAVSDEHEHLRKTMATDLNLMKSSLFEVKMQVSNVASELDRFKQECEQKFESLQIALSQTGAVQGQLQSRQSSEARVSDWPESQTSTMVPDTAKSELEEIRTSLASLMQSQSQVLAMVSRQGKESSSIVAQDVKTTAEVIAPPPNTLAPEKPNLSLVSSIREASPRTVPHASMSGIHDASPRTSPSRRKTESSMQSCSREVRPVSPAPGHRVLLNHHPTALLQASPPRSLVTVNATAMLQSTPHLAKPMQRSVSPAGSPLTSPPLSATGTMRWRPPDAHGQIPQRLS